MPLFGLFGPPDVEKLKAKGNVKSLIKALDYERDRVIRRDAAKALGQIGDTQAVAPLTVALEDEDSDVRRAAAKALGEIGDARAVEPLITALKAQDSDVRKAAAHALGQIDDARGRFNGIIDGWVTDVEERKDWKAARTLGEIGAVLDDTVLQKQVISVLASALFTGNIRMRDAAADALVEIGAPAVEELIGVCGNANVSGVAVDALVKIGTPSVEPLINALSDGGSNDSRRQSAARALGRLGDERAIEPLAIALKNDEHYLVRHYAARALGQIGDPQVGGHLIAALADVDSVSKEAAKALESLGWKPDTPESRAIYSIAMEDWEKCVQIGKPAVEPLIVKLNDHGAEEAARALGRIGDPRAVEPLIAHLKPREGGYWLYRLELVKAAAGALVQIGEPAVGPLIAALNDQDSSRRRYAADALGEIGDARAVEPLIAVLKGEDSGVRKAAAEALGEIGDARGIEPLKAALQDEGASVRETAAEALGKIEG